MIWSPTTWDRERWPNFSLEEMACSHCGRNEMDQWALDAIQFCRTRLGWPFKVTSGYRCPDHPIEAAKDEPGAHATGCAADIACYGARAYYLLEAAFKQGTISGIGVKQHGPHDERFIHLDTISRDDLRPRPWLWGYP